MQTCNACGGTYEAVGSDGLRYFHACPPLSPREIRAAIAAGASPLTPAQAAVLAKVDKLPAPTDAKPGDAAPGDTYLSSLSITRPQHRDENLDPAKIADARDKKTGQLPDNLPADALIKSVGAGVTADAENADAVG